MEEDIDLVRNQGLEVDDYMEPSPKIVPLVYNPAADTRFEGHTWGCNSIYFRAVVAQNHNEPSFKNGWSRLSLSYIDIFLHCLCFKWFRIFLLPSTTGSMEEADIALLALGGLL